MKKTMMIICFFTISCLTIFAFVNPDFQNPVINVVNATADSVVKIDVERTITTTADPFMDEFFKRFFGDRDTPFTGERKQKSVGSGFLFDKEGHILTNEHVIHNAEGIKVTLYDGRQFDAESVGGDSELDIAILRIKGIEEDELPYLEFGDSDNLQIGQYAIAIGNPLGFQHTVTTGVVSATGRQISKSDGEGYYTNLIQTDAAINPGNSGGPLLNIHGEVIGINTAIVNPMAGTNLGFAIPISDVNYFIETLIQFGKLQKPRIGVKIMNITEDIKNALSLDSTNGVIVVEVSPESSAERAGLKPQDIILKFDDVDIRNKEQLSGLIRKQEVGSFKKLLIDRSGMRFELTVEMLQAPEELATSQEPAENELVSEEVVATSELLGFTVTELTDKKREAYQIPGNFDGVFIARVDEKSFAYRMGLRTGAVLQSINRKTIDSVVGFNDLINELKSGTSVALYVFIPGEGSLMLSYPL